MDSAAPQTTLINYLSMVLFGLFAIILIIVPGLIIALKIGLKNAQSFRFTKSCLLGGLLGYVIAVVIFFIFFAVTGGAGDFGQGYIMVLVISLLNFLGGLIGAFIARKRIKTQSLNSENLSS